MKKLYFMIASLLIGGATMAQNDLSFEDWNGNDLNQWVHIPTAIESLPGVTVSHSFISKETVGATDGASYAKLTSFNLTGASALGFPDGNYGSILTQEFTSSNRYSSVYVDLKHNIQTGDEAIFAIYGFDADSNVVARGFNRYTGLKSTFSTDTIDIIYVSPNPIAYWEFIISSSIRQIFSDLNGSPTPSQVPGSELEIDNIVMGSIITPADNVTNVVATDISDNGNGLDLQVTFNISSSEATDVDKYYAFVMDTIVHPSMLANLSAFATNLGVEITPNGSNQTLVFDASEVYYYISGINLVPAPIANNIPLIVYIYTVGKNGKSDVYQGSNVVTLTTLSVENFNKDMVKFFPNPVSEVLNIDFGTNEVASVNIINLNGQVVATQELSNSTAKVNVNNLEAGMYIFQATDAKGNVLMTDKFIKK